VAGIFSPSVVIFKHDLDNGCKELPKDKREIVSVITVAAPRVPDLNADNLAFKNPSDLDDLRGKIQLVYRMAARNGKTSIILGELKARNVLVLCTYLPSRCHGMRGIPMSTPARGSRDEIYPDGKGI
jgi:hypothetical protein